MDTTKITTLLRIADCPDEVIQKLIETANTEKDCGSFRYLKKGDLVFVGENTHPATVTHTTNTQIHIGDNKYRHDGSLIGYSGYSGYRYRLGHITPRSLEYFVERKLETVKGRHIHAMIANLQARPLSYDQVMALFEAFKVNGVIQ